MPEPSADVTMLIGALRNFLTAPSGASICACRNVNAVKAGEERPCAYCHARDVIALAEGAHA